MSSSDPLMPSVERQGAAPPGDRATGLFRVASDPTVQITVYDAGCSVRGHAEGGLELSLPPGLYRVRLERGGAVHNEIVDHERASELSHAGPPLESPTPFAGAATTHGYYSAPAQAISVSETAAPLGDGPHTSRLFVFLRRAARGAPPRRLPSEPVTIHDASGRSLTAITRGNARIDDDPGYVGYASRAAPGTYRLRAGRSRRDVAIVVPAGRAAHVFIADTGMVRLGELRVSLVPATARFDPASPIWRVMESVIAALRAPARALPEAARALLPHAIDDDLCFGIAAAHLLWRSGDRAALAAVMERLRPYREVPDIAILDRLVHLDRAREASPEAMPETPPLLWASLVVAMTRPELDTSDISAHCALAQAARTRLHDSVWCTWSARTWDERWIEPTVERLRARDPRRSARSIAHSLALPAQTVEHALRALAATAPGVREQDLDPPSVPAQIDTWLDAETMEWVQQAFDTILVPGYTIGGVLGRGAQSTVVRATRRADRREIALKVIPVPGGAGACDRAWRALAQIRPVQHPGILAATARGRLPDDAGIWLEMERCQGSVLDLLSEGDAPLALPDAYRYILDALGVLADLHKRGIVHGDIKPGNLLVRHDGTIVIADRALGTAVTPRFAPPEVLAGGERPTRTSDVWSMAATLYFLLTLEYPRDEYAGQGPLDAATDNPLVSIAARRTDLPPELVRSIDRALSPVRDARPRDARCFREQLMSLGAQPYAAGDLDGNRAGCDPVAMTVASGLERPGRFRSLMCRAPRVPRGVQLVASSIAAGVLGLILWPSIHPGVSACERAVRNGDGPRAVRICEQSYAATAEPRDLFWSAQAHLQLDEIEPAAALAAALASQGRDGDADAVLGQIAFRRGDMAAAGHHATHARAAHAASGDERILVTDVALLSRVAWQTGDFTAALVAADDALRLARAASDSHGEALAYLARADALRWTGELAAADAALSSANERASEPCDQAATQLKRGIYQMEAGREALAMAELTRAADANRRCASREVSRQIALGRARLLRRSDPPGALARLDEATRYGAEDIETLVLRGYLAADRGALDEAEDDFDRAANLGSEDPEWPWQIERARAELSELRGGFGGDALAEEHYGRATAMVAALHGTVHARSPYFVASHRAPFDGLLALLARQGRWRAALAVVLELDANDMLRASEDEMLALDRPRHLPSSVVVGTGIAALDEAQRYLRFVPREMPRWTVDQVLAAWRSRDLSIVLAPSRRQIGPGGERAYRLRIAHGHVDGEDVADANAARAWADDLFAAPGARGAARALGQAIVPPEPGAPQLDTRTLDVLAIGSLGKVPLAALRDDDGALIIARRPLVRVLALRAPGPQSSGAGPSVVIADPQGDLPGAAAEGSIVAEAVGAGIQRSGSGTGYAATRARLREAQNAELLHVAASSISGRECALRLADGDVDPAEIVQWHLAPRIAVLATGNSAAVPSEDDRSSIAAALLQSGTAVVIAADRAIGDGAALSLMTSFYAQPDWRTDPARALARVQQTLDAHAATSSDEASKAPSWAAFSVLGRPPEIAATGDHRVPG